MRKTYCSLDFYYMSSFAVAFLCLAFQRFDVVNNFFATTLFIGSYFAFLARDPNLVLKFGVFQIFMLVGAAFEISSLGPMYLSLIPSTVCFFQDIKKGTGFFLLPVLSVPIFHLVNPHMKLTVEEIFFLCTYASWTAFSIYSFFFVNKQGENLVERENNERMFFHDVINQTHGINLFLNSKISRGIGLTEIECIDVMNEMKVIQAQIKDHYKFNHKNLVSNYETMDIYTMSKWVDRVVESFLPKDFVDVHTFYNFPEHSSGLIHYPSFSRIFTNIIKNISEVRTDAVDILFNVNERGVEFVIKNKIFDQSRNVLNLEEKLRRNILDGDHNPVVMGSSGIGLESVSKLCADHNGSFDFYIADGQWVNKVYLPFENSRGVSNAA